jgi:ferrochelatase
MQNREFFVEAGGKELNYIPALNVSDAHIAFLERLIERHADGWPETAGEWSAAGEAADRERSRRRALAMGAAQ